MVFMTLNGHSYCSKLKMQNNLNMRIIFSVLSHYGPENLRVGTKNLK